MDWTACLRTFHLAVEHKSFSKAAGMMHTTPSVVSKRINWLEEELGTELLHRTTRKQTITETGKLLYARTKILFDEWEEIKNEIADRMTEPQGLLRIGVPQNFGNRSLSVIISAFLQEYPHISIEQVFVEGRLAINEVDFDVFITHQKVLVDSDAWVVEEIFRGPKQLFASPRYLEKAGTPKNLRDLRQHNCLISSYSEHFDVWELNHEKVKVRGNFISSDADSLVAAASLGLGIVFTTEKVVYGELKTGLLVPVLPAYCSPDLIINACYAKTLYLPTKIAEFISYVKKHGLRVAELSDQESGRADNA